MAFLGGSNVVAEVTNEKGFARSFLARVVESFDVRFLDTGRSQWCEWLVYISSIVCSLT